jgi:hypothetical protein
VPGLTYALDEVAPGVFAAIAQGLPYYVANSVIVVGEGGVLLVDSSAGTNEARVLREAIRRVTDRPVRYVVDTHFHFDHALGHAAFPEALTIGHDGTRAGLVLTSVRWTSNGNTLQQLWQHSGPVYGIGSTPTPFSSTAAAISSLTDLLHDLVLEEGRRRCRGEQTGWWCRP